MSVESQLRAALMAEPSLTALIGTRAVQNGIQEGAPTPYVVFTATHAFELNLLGDVMADKVTFTVECWATRAFDADAVADAVTVALSMLGAPSASPAEITGRASGFDGDLGLDATVLSVEWWA